jgi:hypothetical protein
MAAIRQTLANLFVWTEGRYAKRASSELLQLYWSVRQAQPELAGRALYEAVVARRLTARSTDAATIVRRAAESFADWPVDRGLQFRDVVHYLVFDEYLRSFTTRKGTRESLGKVVSRIIPSDL